MKEVKEKRELQIDDKIFNINDLAELIRLFIVQSNEILEKHNEIRHQDLIRKGQAENTSHSAIVLTSQENSNYSFTFEEADEAIKTLGNNLITEVELQFNEKVFESRFSVRLRQSGASQGSVYVHAEGRDTDWLNETIRIFKDLLDKCKNQTLFIRKFRIPIIVTTIGMLSFFLFNLIAFFIKTEVSFPKIVGKIFMDDLIYYLILFALVSATPAVLIFRWLKRLYPSVELQTGPYSGKLQNEKRIKLLLMVLLIIVPVVISVLLRFAF